MAIQGKEQKVAGHSAKDGELLARSPGVGFFQASARVGSHVAPGVEIGFLRVLGRRFPVVMGHKCPSAYVEAVLCPKGKVEYEQPLLRLTEGSLAGSPDVSEGGQTSSEAAGLCVLAPQPGRVYLKPEPDKPSYVTAGAEISKGDVLLLIEIMKTFTPMLYPGSNASLPDSVRVVKVLVEDGEEIEVGQALFEVESL